MFKYSLRLLLLASLLLLSVRAAEDVVTAVHGTVTKLDSGAKTMVVKTKDGTEHTIHYVDKTTVHGAEATAGGADKSAKFTVYYSEKAGKKVAHFFEKL